MHIPASFHLTDALFGLAAGTVATAVAAFWVVGSARRSPTDDAPQRVGPVPIALAAAAGLIAMYLARAVRGGLVADIATGPAIVVGVVGVVAGLGWAYLARSSAPALTAAFVMLSAGGVWAAVPDTETAVAVLAAWLPFAAWAVAWGRSMPAPTAPIAVASVVAWIALAIVLAWAAAWGADAKPPSLPGAMACFGVALVVPGVMAATGGTPRLAWLIPAQLVAVIVAARWATDASSTGAGIVRSIAVLAVLTAVVAISSRSAEPARQRPSDRPEHPR